MKCEQFFAIEKVPQDFSAAPGFIVNNSVPI
jgi:hypothetical protein